MSARSIALTVAGSVAAVLAAVLLLVFQPWQLFTVTQVHDALPPVGPTPSVASSPPAVQIAELSRGPFVSYEHQTTGTARLLRLADGSLLVRLEDLSTSNGPDVRVWLSDHPATAAADASGGRWLELGPLRANRGDLNYPVAAGTDLSEYRSVVIWCRRFSVAFAAAPFAPT